MPAVPADTGSSAAPLAPGSGPASVAHFVNDVAPAAVLDALRHCLSPEHRDAALTLVRAKLKPGRTMTAEYDVALPAARLVRRISVTWGAPGATAPHPAPDVDGEVRRRGVLGPFHRSWVVSDDGRMRLSVAPADGAFPQLVRLHDRAHLADVLRATRVLARGSERATRDVRIETVRYRPGQRHVLRVGVGASGSAWFVKVYRDDTGRRTVDAAVLIATAFAGAGIDATAGGSRRAGVHVAADRAAFWPEISGRSLAEVVALSGPAAGEAVRTAGSAERVLHDAPAGSALPFRPDAVGQTAETLRTAHLVDVLVPAVGSRLRLAAGRALASLSALPVEPPTLTHGDFKCDNLLVSGSRVHLIDFDRVGRGDPAADIGKFLADLRWWAAADGSVAERLRAAFLNGYGAARPERFARARMYDALLQLRMAARRVPIQDADWEGRVTRAVGLAAATTAEGA
jgi:Ser/Thr protein kinase RdoA (MazF antagonist)